HAIAIHMGDTNAALLQQRAIFHDPRTTTATAGALPSVGAEAGHAISLFQGRADAVLQAHQIIFYGRHCGGIGNGMHWTAPSQAERMTVSVCRSLMILGLRCSPKTPGTISSSRSGREIV